MRKLLFATALLIPAAAFAQDGSLSIGPNQLDLAAAARVTALETQVANHESRIAALEAAGGFIGVAPEAGNVAQRLWAGSQTAYDAIAVKDANTVYVVIP